ncbi:uncharacterized protein [Panulirus ornatus]|uniref:uncharacterized protein isoform X1 n=1 Tax=Panulirus ornatus TaxID=150431 RepID=UPI003A8C57DF
MARPYITLLACWAAFIVGGVIGSSSSGSGEGDGSKERSSCVYYTGDEVQRPTVPTVTGAGSDANVFVYDNNGRPTSTCTDFYPCFSYWTYQPTANGSSIKWLARGCWGISDENCYHSSCIASSRQFNNSYFCCCTGHMCNDEVHMPMSSQSPKVTPVPELLITGETDPEDKNDFMLVLWVVLAVGFVFLVACITGTALRWRRTKPPPHPMPVEDPPTSPCIDMDSLKFMEIIGQGRFGTAYRAVVQGEEVAVKMYPHHYKSSYQNEKYIYSLPLMEHSNLLSYLGGGECIGPDGKTCYGLVLSYCPNGRLSNFLSANTLSWPVFCHIVLTATRGLAHLHSDIRKGDILKPCVNHRDFNTRNLLLTENLSCVVSDLGFAIHTQGSKYFINGEEQHAETSSLTDVGTLRYMAPEVLEGAVNLRDCEAALKQIDIYALGLVLWECAARCHDLYQGLQTPPYMLPFQAEIGLHPSFEQMQVLVTRNKARPLFPSVWKDTNPAIRLLKETIEDCWDHDAEARLSAMCVEGRLAELPLLWDRYKSSLGVNGVSPTMNPMSNLMASQRQVEMLSGLVGNGGKVISNAITPRDKESSISEATVETTITASPSEPPLDTCLGKNQLVGTLQPPMPPLQPHQGRNPCMERNLIREVPHELSVSGNILIDHMKANDINSVNTINSVNLMDALDVQHALESHGFTNEQLMPLLNGHSNTATVVPQPRPALPPPTLVPPIPYLQNEVRSIDNQPKRQNTAVRDEENRDNGQSSGKGSSWRRWRNAWEDRLKSLIPRRRHHNGEDEERQEILVTPTSSSLSEPPTPLPATQSVAVTAPHLPMQTEVLLTNGGPHTVISPNHTLNTQHSSLPNYIAETEIGIAKLHLQNGFAPVIRSRQGSNDSGLNKSNENSVSFVDSDNSCEKLKRPTTLTLPDRSHQGILNKTLKQQKNQEIDQDPQGTDCHDNDPALEIEESPPLRKAKQRVKTPRRPMNPRLSLYDDRIMGCDEGQRERNIKDEGQLDESLSHSLPIHMDTLEQQQPFLTNSVVVSSAPSQNTSTASLRHSKVASTVSSSKVSSRGGSQGSLGQELPYSHTQPNPQAIGVL